MLLLQHLCALLSLRPTRQRGAPHDSQHDSPRRSLLAWPAWLRVAAVLPVVALLWLAVAWAGLEVAPW